ncbi:MAG TPA: radical SAM protein, partial [Chitinispirillaceae bacterium]|nr:radical SAM protein [Chitinispirillaceae bacterium]
SRINSIVSVVAVGSSTSNCSTTAIAISSNDADLSREQVYYILDKLSAAGVLMITFTGSEPFLHRDFLDILRYTINKDFWKITILTNGSCTNECHIRFISENAKYFSTVQFSAFSHIPSVHDSYTGIPGSYQNLIECAKQLKNSNVPVKIAINILETNYKTFEDSIAFFTKEGFQVSWSIHKLVTSHSSPETREQIRKETSVPFFIEFNSMLKEDSIKLERERFTRLAGRPAEKELTLCKGLFTNIYIDSKGNLLPCVSFRNMLLGSIFDDRPLYEILNNSHDLQKLKLMRVSDIPKCNKCKYITVCHICVGINHTETGSVDIPSEQQCNYTYSLASLFGLEKRAT